MKHIITIFFLFFFIGANGQPVKLMTYNIRYDNKNDGKNWWELRKEKVAELIRYYEPEILGTQEGLFHQIKYLDSTLLKYKFIGVGRDDGMDKGEFCAIFFDTTKFHLLYQSTFWLSETPDRVSVGWDAAMERICTYAIFKNKSNSENIYVFNTHFDHIGKEARKNAADLILEKINRLTGNMAGKIILMGDFNLTPDENPVMKINELINDAKNISIKKPYGPEGTFNGFDITKKLTDRIDYIFTKNVKVLEHVTIDDRVDDFKYPSDHLPVMVTVE